MQCVSQGKAAGASLKMRGQSGFLSRSNAALLFHQQRCEGNRLPPTLEWPATQRLTFCHMGATRWRSIARPLPVIFHNGFLRLKVKVRALNKLFQSAPDAQWKWSDGFCLEQWQVTPPSS